MVDRFPQTVDDMVNIRNDSILIIEFGRNDGADFCNVISSCLR